jgi:XTP/dITP diphosphohydrolase
MDIILSTRNPTKAIEIKTMLNQFDVNILTLSEAGIQGEANEDGNTLEENAAKKIDYAALQLKETSWIMADDSGIFITALDGAPGIKAARWAGDEATTEEIIHYTLQQMDGIKDRSATFKTAIVLQSPDGKKLYFEGLTTGQLAESPKANPKPAMPYTAIFSPDGTNKVLAEMTIEEQKGLSSRGKAVLQVVAFLKGFLNS